jgi:hypothetical protein
MLRNYEVTSTLHLSAAYAHLDIPRAAGRLYHEKIETIFVKKFHSGS